MPTVCVTGVSGSMPSQAQIRARERALDTPPPGAARAGAGQGLDGGQGFVVPRRKTVDGWTIVTIHYSLIPDYDYEEACKGLTGPQIEVELNINWNATGGKAVYPEFGRGHIAATPLTFDPNSPLICGWDFGGSPGFVPTQINSAGQWLIFPSLSGPRNRSIGIYEFGQQVADHLLREYAEPFGLSLDDLDLVHYGDPAGKARPRHSQLTANSKIEMRSAFDVLQHGIRLVRVNERGKRTYEDRPGWGWEIRKGAVSITERLESVRARLNLMTNGVSALLVCPNATDMVVAFSGGYCYRQRSDGTYEHDPDKNEYSHIMDALAYVASRIYALPGKRNRRYRGDDEGDNDDDWSGSGAGWSGHRGGSSGFRSHASRSY